MKTQHLRECVSVVSLSWCVYIDQKGNIEVHKNKVCILFYNDLFIIQFD